MNNPDDITPQKLDSVEIEYIRAINYAGSRDPDRAFELTIGLAQYRELYKINPHVRAPRYA